MTWRFAEGVRVPTPVIPAGPKMPRMFEVAALRDVEAITTGLCRAFDAKTLPWTCRFAVGALMPTPTSQAGPNILVVFAVRALIDVVAKTFGAWRAFEANRLP